MNREQRQKLKEMVAANKVKAHPGEIVSSFIQLAPDAQKAPRKPQAASEAPGGDITYQCGHKGSLHHLKGQACPACRSLGRKAKGEKHRAKMAANKAARPVEVYRLPVGSQHKSTYLADDLWESTLTVPQGMGQMEIFVGSASGLHAAEHAAFAKYRESLDGSGSGG